MKIQIELVNPPSDTKQWNVGIVRQAGSQFQNLADLEELECTEGEYTLTVLMWVWSPGSSFPSKEIANFRPIPWCIYRYNWETNTIEAVGEMEQEEESEIPEGYEICPECGGEAFVDCPKCVCSKCHGEGEVECKKCDGTGWRKVSRRKRRIWDRG